MRGHLVVKCPESSLEMSVKSISLGAPPLKSSPFGLCFALAPNFFFQSFVHGATKTAESNFGAHVFIIPVVKKKFGLFRTMKSFNFI